MSKLKLINRQSYSEQKFACWSFRESAS